MGQEGTPASAGEREGGREGAWKWPRARWVTLVSRIHPTLQTSERRPVSLRPTLRDHGQRGRSGVEPGAPTPSWQPRHWPAPGSRPGCRELRAKRVQKPS